MGAYLPDMREADDDTMRRGMVFTCCDRGRDEVGELTLPVATGALSWDDIRGDAFGIVQGSGIRDVLQRMRLQSYKNIGGAHQDVFTSVVLRQAAGL